MKKFSKILVVVVCLLLTGCNDIDFKDIPNKEPINIYLFYGDGCKFCEKLMVYFEELEETYGNYYNLVKYEVWNNEENRILMDKVGEELNVSTSSVPFLVIDQEVIVGYGGTDESNKKIKNEIAKAYNSSNFVDIVEKIKSS